ncbi:MAG: DUF4386 domain-containing protein [Myxococcaceae bacterium]|nr:DUF4386 domain-containing protein [Myxococcaceae bacterium]
MTSTERRTAGALSLSFIAISGLHFSVFEQPLLPTRAAADVAAYLLASPAHARLGALVDLFVFATGAAMAVALYRLVREHRLSVFVLAALLVGMGVSVAIELSTFAALSLAKTGSLDGIAAVQQARSAGYTLTMFFYGLALTGWSWLALRGAQLARPLAWLGLAANVALVFVTAAKVVQPVALELPVMAVSSVTMLFQVSAGVALLLPQRARSASTPSASSESGTKPWSSTAS